MSFNQSWVGMCERTCKYNKKYGDNRTTENILADIAGWTEQAMEMMALKDYEGVTECLAAALSDMMYLEAHSGFEIGDGMVERNTRLRKIAQEKQRLTHTE